MSDDTQPKKPREVFKEVTWRWWSELEDRRADRAELRRSASNFDALLTAPLHRLRRRLDEAGFEVHQPQLDHLAAVARVLVHMSAAETNAKRSNPGKAFGGSSSGDGTPRLSESRFRRLITTEDRDALATLLRRAVPLAADALHVGQLAWDVYRWSEKTRRQWATDYYASTSLD